MNEPLWHKRLHDFESFDKITFEIVPRYKTSGMSGDEWRQHIEVKFWFKGEEVFKTGYNKMEAALMLSLGDWIRQQEPIPERVIEIEKNKCDQPSCTDDAIGRFRLKATYDRQSGKKLPGDEDRYYRQFCKRHLRRGDCGFEDADENYVPLSGLTAADSTNKEESPSATVVLDLRGA